MQKKPARAAFWRSFWATAALLAVVTLVILGMGCVRTAAARAGFGAGYTKNLQVSPAFFSQNG